MNGEEYIVDIERKNLINAGKSNLAEKVKHISKEKGDGYGYDILSYTPDNKEKYIEVKTTATSCSNPIYISSRELALSKKKKNNFYLYRVFNFDKISNTGKIKIIQGPIDESALIVDGYRAFIE